MRCTEGFSLSTFIFKATECSNAGGSASRLYTSAGVQALAVDALHRRL
jgi:hypothetical protein